MVIQRYISYNKRVWEKLPEMDFFSLLPYIPEEDDPMNTIWSCVPRVAITAASYSFYVSRFRLVFYCIGLMGFLKGVMINTFIFKCKQRKIYILKIKYRIAFKKALIEIFGLCMKEVLELIKKV